MTRLYGNPEYGDTSSACVYPRGLIGSRPGPDKDSIACIRYAISEIS